jgi:putative ABC transport system permease protein
VEFNIVGYDYAETLGLELTAGRDFSRDFPTDRLQAFVLNETAAKLFGWQDDPLDRQLHLGNLTGRVIGVVRDFHTKSLHSRIEPLVLFLAPTPDSLHFAAAKIGPENVPGTLGFLEGRWREIYPHDPFIYSFLEDDLGGLYRNEELRGRIFIAFSVLTIIIACLGLFGLASFSAERRSKEIGIRKVLGAPVSGLVGLLAREFVGLVLLANAIAWPLAYFVMHRWLRSFAYRTSLDLRIFPLVAVLACAIAVLTVGFQSVRAALADPVDSIRTE